MNQTDDAQQILNIQKLNHATNILHIPIVEYTNNATDDHLSLDSQEIDQTGDNHQKYVSEEINQKICNHEITSSQSEDTSDDITVYHQRPKFKSQKKNGFARSWSWCQEGIIDIQDRIIESYKRPPERFERKFKEYIPTHNICLPRAPAFRVLSAKKANEISQRLYSHSATGLTDQNKNEEHKQKVTHNIQHGWKKDLTKHKLYGEKEKVSKDKLQNQLHCKNDTLNKDKLQGVKDLNFLGEKNILKFHREENILIQQLRCEKDNQANAKHFGEKNNLIKDKLHVGKDDSHKSNKDLSNIYNDKIANSHLVFHRSTKIYNHSKSKIIQKDNLDQRIQNISRRKQEESKHHHTARECTGNVEENSGDNSQFKQIPKKYNEEFSSVKESNAQCNQCVSTGSISNLTHQSMAILREILEQCNDKEPYHREISEQHNDEEPYHREISEQHNDEEPYYREISEQHNDEEPYHREISEQHNDEEPYHREISEQHNDDGSNPSITKQQVRKTESYEEKKICEKDVTEIKKSYKNYKTSDKTTVTKSEFHPGNKKVALPLKTPQINKKFQLTSDEYINMLIHQLALTSKSRLISSPYNSNRSKYQYPKLSEKSNKIFRKNNQTDKQQSQNVCNSASSKDHIAEKLDIDKPFPVGIDSMLLNRSSSDVDGKY